MQEELNRAQPIIFSRRAVLKTLGAGAGALAVWPYLSDQAAEAFALVQQSKAPPQLKFLTEDQYATLESLTELIIPADEHSPGAKEARVADYIDLLLAESGAEMQKDWTKGLAALDAESSRRFQVPFMRLGTGQAVDLLNDLSRNELDADSAPLLEKFFKDTKDATIRGYYTSEIGIHQELGYKGNRYLTEFVGCTHPEHGYDPTR
jgi:hypothetical protein